MTPGPVPISLAITIMATSSMAASINAESSLTMRHSYLVNNGNTPAGIDITPVAQSLDITGGFTSTVDDPTFVNNRTSSFQVGNQFAEPPVPVMAEQLDETLDPASSDGARAQVDYTITIEDDFSGDTFGITSETADRSGSATVQMTDNPSAASASSFYTTARSYNFENTTNDLISFNIVGLFEAELLARYDGSDGFARTSGGFDLLFDPGVGVDINYFPVAPYLTTIEDDDPNAFVSEQFLANSGGILGVSFNASASAFGDGDNTVAQYSGQSRYVFGISMDPGSSLILNTDRRQSNAVGYTPTPDMTPVPLPASLPMLIAGLLGLRAMRRVRQAK